jgi:hypothetical protein
VTESSAFSRPRFGDYERRALPHEPLYRENPWPHLLASDEPSIRLTLIGHKRGYGWMLCREVGL